jgi:hypothetical protein
MSDTIERDTRGRFLTGVKAGPGRPKGNRNRHTENFLKSFADDFEQYGPAVIAQVRVEKPDVYLRIAVDLLPRESKLDVDIDIELRASEALQAFRVMKSLAEPERHQLVIEHAAAADDDTVQ